MTDATSDAPTLGSPVMPGGKRVADRYEVRGRLGRGAYKDVYLAYDQRLDRLVALAIVFGASGNSIARLRVEREARVTGRLGDHPNVVTVYDIGEVEGVPYLVLRCMQGGSLADVLRARRLEPGATIRIGRDIAAALAHAHAHGVVHRDVKPDNVWMTGDGAAALGDFGIAYEPGAERITGSGTQLGTVRYMAPEQIRGEAVGPAADLYALGVTLYELATGTAPFSAPEPDRVLAAHLAAPPPVPSERAPGLPLALDRLILELLAKDPERRPPSAIGVAQVLAGMSDDRSSGVPAVEVRRIAAVVAARARADDPELVHTVLERGAHVIERYGGAVHSYVGDMLVGLFGATQTQEDDLRRAARAGLALCDDPAGLHVGVETGELFLRHGAATGTAISSAGRLAAQAGQGELLLGDRARSALRQEARISTSSGRLLALGEPPPALLRRPVTPFLGRDRELAELNSAFARVCEEDTCLLVTVVGAPGMGKSRLSGAFVAGLRERATVLVGMCRAHGEGTTYDALGDIVHALGGPRIEELVDAQAAQALRVASDPAAEPSHPQETSFAFRRLLQAVARGSPTVVAFEDVHWAQPALLGLIEHIAALASGAPLLLLCLARPELLESHPAWATPHANRRIVSLDALPREESRQLAARLGAGARAEQIVRRAEGNPLFIEQLIAVGDDELPPSLQAVLAARIDRLQPDERMLIRHAAAQGRTFHVGALAGRDRADLDARLVTLVGKGLIAAGRSEFAGEEAFRFTHALIQEAAYAGIPKVERAELHASVGEWLARRPGVADEVVGFHLEQACRLRREAGSEPERAIALHAADRLRAASRRSLAAGEPAAACGLLERAIALVDGDAAVHAELSAALGAALFEAGRMAEAALVLEDAVARAPTPGLAARAIVEREIARLQMDTSATTEERRRTADAALGVLAEAGDAPGLARAWLLRGQLAWVAGRVAEADDAWRTAAGFARHAEDERAILELVSWRATAAALGPMPVEAAIALCEELREEAAPSQLALASVLNPLASLRAMGGDFALADRHLEEANAILHRLGSLWATVSHHEALIRLLQGRPDLAEVPLRAGLERLRTMGDRDLLATTAAMLAQAVHAQGQVVEADELCAVAAQAASPDDIVTQLIWRGVRARTLAAAGTVSEGLELAREAVAMADATDLLSHRGGAMLALADMLAACGRHAEAHDAVRGALRLYARKGHVVGMLDARKRLEEGS